MIERWYIDSPRGTGRQLDRTQADLGPALRPNRHYDLPLGHAPGQEGDDYGHHLILPRRLLERATPLAGALGMQRLVLLLLAAGYRRQQHPLALQADLAALRRAAAPDSPLLARCQPARGRWGGQLRFFFSSRQPGRTLQTHFCDLDGYRPLPTGHLPLAEALRRPRRLYNAVRRVAAGWRAITTTNVICALSRSGPVVPSPIGYMALLRQLKYTGSVYDVDPQLGSKALACAALGLPYNSPVPNPDLAAYIGLAPATGAPGLVIADGCFNRQWTLPAAEPPWHGKNVTVLLFVPQEHASLPLPGWLGRPRWRLRVAVDSWRRDPDYLLCCQI